mmetsp:Transcript_38462/g.85864  ORF Transcript_38462/g.85864 Transcript_38462/m.85864 type:complete len:263 (-) Transcript_38462:322-1110(-)
MTHRGEALMVMFHLVVAAHLKIKVEMAHPKLKVKLVEMANQVLLVMPRLKVKVKIEVFVLMLSRTPHYASCKLITAFNSVFKMPPMVKKTALIVMFRLLVAAHLKIKVEMAHPKLKVKVEMANQVLMVMSHLKLKLKAKMVKVKLKIKKIKVKVEMAHQVLMVMPRLKVKVKIEVFVLMLSRTPHYASCKLITAYNFLFKMPPIVMNRYLLFLLFRLNVLTVCTMYDVDPTMTHPYRRIHLRRPVFRASWTSLRASWTCTRK